MAAATRSSRTDRGGQKDSRDIERIYANPDGVPRRAQLSIEHERDDDEEEIEFQLTWTLRDEDAADAFQEPDDESLTDV